MNNLPANTGWLWIKQGFQYFRQQPMEFITLFFSYLFFVLLLGLLSYLTSDFIPHLGQFLAFVLLPLFTLSFMQACREIDQGLRVRPQLILYGFRSPQIKSLILLGLLYLIAACIALGISTMVDGGLFLQFISGQEELSPANMEGSDIGLAMLVAILIYAPALMTLWFAGPLIAWRNMSLFKAVFYSFFASIRSVRAFLVFALAWFTVAGIIPAMLIVLVAELTGSQDAVVMLLMPVYMLSSIVLYCTFYPSYKSVFGQATTTESSTIS